MEDIQIHLHLLMTMKKELYNVFCAYVKDIQFIAYTDSSEKAIKLWLDYINDNHSRYPHIFEELKVGKLITSKQIDNLDFGVVPFILRDIKLEDIKEAKHIIRCSRYSHDIYCGTVDLKPGETLIYE